MLQISIKPNVMKRKAKFNLSMPIPQKLSRTGEIVTSMTGNPDFPVPVPDLANVSTAVSELGTAHQAALDKGLTAKADQRAKNVVLNDLLRQLRDYVNGVAQGDETLVLSSGFEASKIPAPIGPMPQVVNLLGKGGDGDGSVKLRWKSVYGAKNYVVQQGVDAATMVPIAYPSAATTVVTGLVIGNFYWFRVAANGAAGLGPFSDPFIALAS